MKRLYKLSKNKSKATVLNKTGKLEKLKLINLNENKVKTIEEERKKKGIHLYGDTEAKITIN